MPPSPPSPSSSQSSLPSLPHSPLYGASALLIFGYGGIRFIFINARPASTYDDSRLVFALASFSFAIGLAGSVGVKGALNAVAQVFPSRLVRLSSFISSFLAISMA